MAFPLQHKRKLLLAAAAALAGAAGELSCSNTVGGETPDFGADQAMWSGPYNDLPSSPIGTGGVSEGQLPGIAMSFNNATSMPTGGPCISEPSMGALFPSNFNSPKFEWTPPAGHNIFELKFHIANQLSDLVVYTDQLSFSMDDLTWRALSLHSMDQDIQVSVRSGILTAGQLTGSVYLGTSGKVRIAPVDAPGAIVYWTTTGSSALKGFHIGDKGVSTVLTPKNITDQGTATTCVGCHVSTPDGLAAVFGRADPGFTMDARLVDGSAKRPSWMSQNAINQLMTVDQAMGTMSSALFAPPTQAILVSPMKSAATANKYELVWTNLAAATGGFGILQRMGDSRQAATPSFNGNGSRIAYTSSDAVVNSRVDMGVGEIWTVPYNNGQGGMALPLTGAADIGFNQYYPAYSPRDTFIAFNRIARGAQMYNSVNAEVFLVPGAGGVPTRIAGNDPPSCTGLKSPGITNSWPRWSPNATTHGNFRYYWLVFSSTRRPNGVPPLPQLYLSAVITDISSGSEVLYSTTPAVYIPSQKGDEANHTPAWDLFKIPVVG